MQNPPKLWTVLIYANGNNELASIMQQAKENLEIIGSTSEINIIILIGRAEEKLRKIIKPTLHNSSSGKNWTGVRCYYIKKSHSKLLYKYNNLNMADPKTLYSFLKWAVAAYPAHHYLLILSGHGCPLVGVMPDFCQRSPYLMGLPEMCQTINLLYKETGQSIDLLVLDICYMNYLEVIYELGAVQKQSVRYLLTYMGNGPLEGLPYHLLIEVVQQSCRRGKVVPVANLVAGIVSRFNLNLAAFLIDYDKCQRIKELVRKFAYTRLLYYNLQDKLDNHTSVFNTPLEIMRAKTEDWNFLNLYSKFSFHQDNFWIFLLNSHLLQRSDLLIEANAKEKLEPLVMGPNMVRQYLKAINPELNSDQLEIIYQKLYDYKKWVNFLTLST
jgi:hypothetical protein